METSVTNGRDGWTAETYVKLDEKRSIRVSTYKDSRGVTTRATVVEPTEFGFTYVPLDDFSECVREGRGLRCTEKTVRSEHAAALADIEAVKVRAREHYAEDEQAEPEAG